MPGNKPWALCKKEKVLWPQTSREKLRSQDSKY